MFEKFSHAVKDYQATVDLAYPKSINKNFVKNPHTYSGNYPPDSSTYGGMWRNIASVVNGSVYEAILAIQTKKISIYKITRSINAAIDEEDLFAVSLNMRALLERFAMVWKIHDEIKKIGNLSEVTSSVSALKKVESLSVLHSIMRQTTIDPVALDRGGLKTSTDIGWSFESSQANEYKYGGRVPDANLDLKPVNIMTRIKNLNKHIPGVYNSYHFLSYIVHPNFGDVLCGTEQKTGPIEKKYKGEVIYSEVQSRYGINSSFQPLSFPDMYDAKSGKGWNTIAKTCAELDEIMRDCLNWFRRVTPELDIFVNELEALRVKLAHTFVRKTSGGQRLKKDILCICMSGKSIKLCAKEARNLFPKPTKKDFQELYPDFGKDN